jgi:HK97 family phage portal protein
MSTVLVRSLEAFRKGLTFTPLPPGGWTWGSTSGLSGEQTYSEVGDGSRSSLVEACVSWIASAATQTHPSVLRYDRDEDLGTIDRTHPAARLMRRPTYDARVGRSYYSWIPLIQATLTSFTVAGNAYWRKRRSATRLPVQLWYQPYGTVTPHRRDFSSYFVDYYEVRNGARTERVQPEDMIHFRDSLDPLNPMMGISKLRTLFREIFSDETAARWTASLLRNEAVPGLILAPDSGAATMTVDEAKLVKEEIEAKTTGDNRGRMMVFGAPTKVQQYGFSPEQMKLGDIRDIPEERVSAVLGVSAGVVGFGAGLQTAKVGATMGELVDLSWQNGVLPRLRLMAAELTEQLLPDFGEGEDLEFIFDTSRVPIMADYQNKVAEKHERLVRSNIEQRGEARRAVGLKAGPKDDVYTLQAGVQVMNPDGTLQVEPPAPPTPAPAPELPKPDAQLALPAPKALSKRETEIAGMIARGRTTKAIAAELGISGRTVEREISGLMEKADVESRTELVAWVMEQKAEDAPPPNTDVADAIAGAQAALAQMREQITELAEKSGTKTDPTVLAWMERSEANVLRVVEGQGAILAEVAKALGNKPTPVATVMEVERDENGRVLRSTTRPEN